MKDKTMTLTCINDLPHTLTEGGKDYSIQIGYDGEWYAGYQYFGTFLHMEWSGNLEDCIETLKRFIIEKAYDQHV